MKGMKTPRGINQTLGGSIKLLGQTGTLLKAKVSIFLIRITCNER